MEVSNFSGGDLQNGEDLGVVPVEVRKGVLPVKMGWLKAAYS